MKIIDLRSDTVTRPTPEMKQVMMEAELGDDVFGEDPSVLALEAQVAEMFGKEAALFCPSGTMTNQIGINIHTRPGEELICDAHSHIYHYEAAGIAFNSGVQAKLLQGNNGCITVSQVEESINPDFDWLPRTSLVCLENTVNRAGGSVYDTAEIARISAFCKQKNIPLHLDGARIFNALAVTGDSPAGMGQWFDTISVCFSKGLGAPVGSALLGTRDHIKRARKVRKVLGGGMRQAGVLASAALYALRNHVNRLPDDHRKAAALAEAIADNRYTESVMPVETNIVIFTLRPGVSGNEYLERLREKGVLCTSFGGSRIRMVTHLDVSDEDTERACRIIAELEV